MLLAIACTSPAAQPVPDPKTVASGKTAVQVFTRQEGDTTHFLVVNHELCEVTLSIEMGLVNLKPNVSLPYTASFPPGRVTEAFALTPERPGDDWSFTYTGYSKLGSNSVRGDDHCIYELPFEPGERVEVSQGYNGKFSHTGFNKYAIDWEMPQGTLVRAARGGLVVRTKQDSDRGGGSMDYDHYNNYVLIRHDDGTLGQYCHLKKGGVLVKPGQAVAVGDPIAHSGNTGFSSGPHLHFCVFMARSGHEGVSIPVKFHTSEASALIPLSGHFYQAAKVSLAGAKASAHAALSRAAAAAQHRHGSKVQSGSLASVEVTVFHKDSGIRR